MRRNVIRATLVGTLVLLAAEGADAQMRRRAEGGERVPEGPSLPRNPRFPYEGSWVGTRTMPLGAGEIGLRFSVVDGRYTGVLVHPGGGTVPQEKLTATAAGLSWESPNSGGGTWVYTVRLVAPDSMTGTLVLRDPPAELTPAPTGTLVLTRRLPAATKGQ